MPKEKTLLSGDKSKRTVRFLQSLGINKNFCYLQILKTLPFFKLHPVCKPKLLWKK